MSVRVREVAEQVRGVTYAKGDASLNPQEGYLPILRANNIREDGLHFQDLVFVPEAKVSKKQILRDGDVVIAASSGSLDVVGKAAQFHSSFNGGFGAFCKVLRPISKRIDPLYFSHFFRTSEYRRKIMSLAAGANINNLKNEHLDELEIPLPPLDEQRRIAAILDKADALRQKRKQAIALLDSMTQAIFEDYFVTETGEKWCELTVAELAEDIRTGPFGSQLLHSEFTERGIPVLGIDNVVSNIFSWRERRFISLEKYNLLKRYTVRPMDILISIMGTNGRCAIVPHDIGTAITTKHVCCITLKKESCTPEYIHAAFLRHPSIRKQLGVHAKGAVMPGLNIGIIKNLSVPVPPKPIQERFSRVTHNLGTVRETMESALDTAHSLFTSLQSRAFSGQL